MGRSVIGWLEMWGKCGSACQVASQPPTHISKSASRPEEDKGRGSSYYGGSQGVLKLLDAPQREAVGGNTADWSASKQEGDRPPPPLLPACMFKGKWRVYWVRWRLKCEVDEKWYKIFGFFFLFFKNGFFFLTRNKILSLWCLSRQIYMLKICDILAWNGGGWILFVLSLE